MIGDAKEKLVLALAAVFSLCSCLEVPDNADDTDLVEAPRIDFNYVSVSGGRIRTLHELKYEVATTGNFHVTEPKNRVEYFDDTPYKISLAAFTSDDSALMVHAEEVADASGASDYSNLAPAEWPDETFRSSGPICLLVPAEEVEEEHDLLWLRNNGFEPSGTILLAQYFATTADMNTEIVISILQHVASCDEESANLELIGAFQARTSVTRIE